MGTDQIHDSSLRPLLRWQVTSLILFYLAASGGALFFKILSMQFKWFDRKPFNCPFCTGFWIAAALMFLQFKNVEVYFIAASILGGSAMSWAFVNTFWRD